MAEPSPLISVVICTHNGSRTLTLAMQAVMNQSLEHGVYEVILVDDASTDDSGRIASEAGARVIRREQSAGLAAARNTGLAAARGELIVFTDDDCEPAHDWLERLIAPLDDRRIDGVTGYTTTASTESLAFRYLQLRNPLRPLPLKILETTTPLARLRTYLRTETGPSPSLPAGARTYNLVGANMVIRRTVIDAVGGFDETFVQSEDEQLCRRIHEATGGATFVYEPAARTRHHYRPGFGDTLRRARIYGHGNALMSRWQRRMPVIYPFPLLLLLAFLYSLARRPRLLLGVAAGPVLCYARWLPTVTSRGAEGLIYPYMQLLQEASFLRGELHYLLHGDD